MPDVLLLSGSPTAKSKSASLLEYAGGLLRAQGLSSSTFSVRDFPAEDLIQARYDSASFNDLKALLEDARALIIGTPIYKASFTGSLKALLDILPQSALRGKTVLPIATGGTLAHLLAIDYSLKPVLAALGATDLRQGVYVVDSQFQYAGNGFVLEDEAQERLDASLRQLAGFVKRAA